MAEQLIFDLPTRAALGRGDFFVSEANALAVARLDDVAGWPNGRLALVGPEGAGKTHLAQVWAGERGASTLAAATLGESAAASLAGPVVIEDADLLPRVAEESLFHLLNAAQAGGHAVLLVARTAPSRWDTALPDLASRLGATDIARIEPPDDALLAAMLVKLFADRQVQVPAALIPWLVLRIERSFAAAQETVAALDAAALAEGKAVSVALARRVLDKMADETR